MSPGNNRLPTYSARTVWFPRLDLNQRSPGCEPGTLASELLGIGAGGQFRAVDAHGFNVPLYRLSYSGNWSRPRGSNPAVSALCRRAPPPGGWIGLLVGTEGTTRTPIWWFRATCPTGLDDLGVAPPTGIEPAAFRSTAGRPLQGTTEA